MTFSLDSDICVSLLSGWTRCWRRPRWAAASCGHRSPGGPSRQGYLGPVFAEPVRRIRKLPGFLRMAIILRCARNWVGESIGLLSSKDRGFDSLPGALNTSPCRSACGGGRQTVRRTSMRMLGRLIVVLAVTIAGCTSAPPPPPATTVPITSFQMGAGKWQGTVVGLSGSKDEGASIEVTIGEDGSYDFGMFRTIGMFGGKGQFGLKDGKLTSQSQRGNAEYTLSERGGRQYLRGEGLFENNRMVTADLTRKR